MLKTPKCYNSINTAQIAFGVVGIDFWAQITSKIKLRFSILVLPPPWSNFRLTYQHERSCWKNINAIMFTCFQCIQNSNWTWRLNITEQIFEVAQRLQTETICDDSGTTWPVDRLTCDPPRLQASSNIERHILQQRISIVGWYVDPSKLSTLSFTHDSR